MSTEKLGLPLITGNMANDVPRDLNALAEAVDNKAASAADLAAHEAENATGAHNISNITGLQAALDGKQGSLPVENRRKITFGTAEPTGGVDGDIYHQYE